MIALPLIYFIFVFAYFWSRQRHWNLDLAATALLIVISACAIIIDVKDLYGEYGINENNITLPTLLLFCFQWTLVLVPIHFLSQIPIQRHHQVKGKLLYLLVIAMAASSIIVLGTSITAIKEALVMDMLDVRNQHYEDLAAGAMGEGNYLLVLPNILCCNPFPTLALFFWLYLKTFTNAPLIVRAGILMASVVQAITSIVTAGRSAMIYWTFDFFLLYSYFYQYLPKSTKRVINLTALTIGGLIGFVFISITIARFDTTDSLTSNPLDSLFGYAGQHINNFSTMIVHGGETPLSLDRIFPLFSKLTGAQGAYDMADHYDMLVAHVPSGVLVNVFDTFGGELYLDLGWVGYISFMLLLMAITLYIRNNWQELTFHRIFVLAIAVAFFSHGLFAWPFITHYPSMAIILLAISSFLFKYEFRI
jgi:hypothetical protein